MLVDEFFDDAAGLSFLTRGVHSSPDEMCTEPRCRPRLLLPLSGEVADSAPLVDKIDLLRDLRGEPT